MILQVTDYHREVEHQGPIDCLKLLLFYISGGLSTVLAEAERDSMMAIGTFCHSWVSLPTRLFLALHLLYSAILES